MPESRTPYDDALYVVRQLRQAGFEALFAGGCVRDVLLGQSPKDFDVATSAQPQQVRELFRNTQAVGAAFGVILVRQGSSVIEVATFRTDLEYHDGRRPTGVKFTTADEDAQRRDFTINGLFLDPVEDRVIDYVGGQADLQARVLRAIGNAGERFAEDHLRMLRAVRFASRLGFQIEASTAAAIKTHGHELIRISPERIGEELRKMLLPATRDKAFALIEEFGLLAVLMRFLPEKPGDRRSSLLAACGDGRPFTLGLALAAIVTDFRMLSSGQSDLRVWLAPTEARRGVNAMRQALKISNDEAAEMTGALAWGQLLGDPIPTVAMLKRFLQQPYSAEARRLMRGFQRRAEFSGGIPQCPIVTGAPLAAEAASPVETALSDTCVVRITCLLARFEELLAGDYAPLPLITGDDLTAAGAKPGPKFKKALDAAYDAQLEGEIRTKDEAMQIALLMVGR